MTNQSGDIREEWRPIPGYEGLYEVSNWGNARSLDRVVTLYNGGSYVRSGQLLKQRPAASDGYMIVRLPRGWAKVHVLVLEAFVGPRPDGYVACHYDDNPTNNHIANLRWDTKSANGKDAVRNGRNALANKTHCVNGHPLSGSNLYTNPNVGNRQCRTCVRASHARRSAEAIQ